MYLNIPGKYKVKHGTTQNREKKSLTKEDAQNVFGSSDDYGDCRIDKRYWAEVTRAHVALSTKNAPLEEDRTLTVYVFVSCCFAIFLLLPFSHNFGCRKKQIFGNLMKHQTGPGRRSSRSKKSNNFRFSYHQRPNHYYYHLKMARNVEPAKSVRTHFFCLFASFPLAP